MVEEIKNLRIEIQKNLDTKNINILKLHPHFPILAVGVDDNKNKIRLWKILDNEQSPVRIGDLKGHRGLVTCISFDEFRNKNKLLIATGSEDNTIKIWCVDIVAKLFKVTLRTTLEGFRDINSISFLHYTHRYLATSSKWDLDTKNYIKLWKFSSDCKNFYFKDLICIYSQQENVTGKNCVVFHNLFNIVAIGSDTLKLFEIEYDYQGNIIFQSIQLIKSNNILNVDNQNSIINCLVFHPSLPILATVCNNGFLKLYKINKLRYSNINFNYKMILSINTNGNNIIGNNYSINSIVFHPTEKKILLAISNNSGVLNLWEIPGNSYFKKVASLENNYNLTFGHGPDSNESYFLVSNNNLNINFKNLDFYVKRDFRDFVISSRDFAAATIYTIPPYFQKELKNNSVNNSCPNFKHLYDEIMLLDLDRSFKFEFKDQNGVDAKGITRIIFDNMLPVYINLYFKSIDEYNFIILKEKLNMEKLKYDTKKIILLAEATKDALIFLKIHPKLLDFLLKSDEIIEYFNNTKKKNFKELYKFFEEEIQQLNIRNGINNYFINSPSNHFKNKESINSLINPGEFNKLNNNIKKEIRLRRFAKDCGFSTWKQLNNMKEFIKEFWKEEIFTNELKFDIESFKKRLQIKQLNSFLDLNNKSKFPTDYPALFPIVDYILDPNEEADDNRRKFIRLCTGTQYSNAIITILLTNNFISPALHKGKPFYVHSCFNRIDLFKNPGNKNIVINKNYLNTLITFGADLSSEE
jgi:hypothetical protein